MSRKWLKSSLILIVVFQFIESFSQKADTTLPTFTKTEILTPLNSFSSIQLEVDSTAFSSLDELLEQNSPVYLKNYGNGQLATLSIRGNGASQTQLFWNGFKLNSPTLGQTDLSLIPTFFINSANLNYSGGSSVNGSGGIGGSLDLATKLNWKKGVHGSYGKQLGSFQNSMSTFSLSFGGKKVFQQVKLLTRKGENDFPYLDISQQNQPIVNQINNKLFQYGGQYELGARLNDKNLLQATVLYFNSYRELPPIIGAVNNQENQADEAVRTFVTWKSFQEHFSSDFRVSYFKEKLNYTDSISSIFSEVDINTYQAQFRTKFQLIKAFDVEASIQNSLAQANSTGFAQQEQRNEVGMYVKISETLPKLYYEIYGRQEVIDEDFSPVVFGGGFVYTPFKRQIKLRGNLSSNYRVPTLNDLYWSGGGNQDLMPENGWSGEVGVDFSDFKKRFDFTGLNSAKIKFDIGVTAFINQTENWIQWIPTESGIWSPVNVKEIENKGVEAQLNYQFLNKNIHLKADLFYTYTHSRNKSFATQNQEITNRIPIYIPTHKATGRFSIKKNKWSAFYSQLYNGRVFIDESNSTYLPHYFPANIGFGYYMSFNKIRYNFGLRINNLYNEPYQVVANRPLPGRNYQVNFNLSF